MSAGGIFINLTEYKFLRNALLFTSTGGNSDKVHSNNPRKECTLIASKAAMTVNTGKFEIFLIRL